MIPLSERIKAAVRQPSPSENVANSEQLSAKLVASPSPSPTVAGVQAPADLAPGEKLVSYIYCRMCRRDPCRQPAATMCGHMFCYQCVLAVYLFLRCPLMLWWRDYRCISSEVMKTSRCPVCEAPTLLYSVFKLHLV
jgi:hypothetical protein